MPPENDTTPTLKLWSDEEGRTLIVAEAVDAARKLSGLHGASWFAIPDDEQVCLRQEWPDEPGTPLGPEWAKVSIEWAEGVSATLGAPGLWVSGGHLMHTAPAAMWCTYGRGFCVAMEADDE